jgi:hypothetical protein
MRNEIKIKNRIKKMEVHKNAMITFKKNKRKKIM